MIFIYKTRKIQAKKVQTFYSKRQNYYYSSMSLRYRREFEAYKNEWLPLLVEEYTNGGDQAWFDCRGLIDWSTIYKKLHNNFKRDVWNPNKLKLKISTNGS